MEQELNMIKDEGLQQIVMDSYPYDVVRGAWEGSFDSPETIYTALNHSVPANKQLKLLFLRITTQEDDGARFRIVQTNPTATGETGTVEAYPVAGKAPAGNVDYPFLEAPGAEVLHGNLRQPVHVLEGSVDFQILDTPTPSTGSRYSIVWWGTQSIAEQDTP
jgi:hypothetical protein